MVAFHSPNEPSPEPPPERERDERYVAPGVEQYGSPYRGGVPRTDGPYRSSAHPISQPSKMWRVTWRMKLWCKVARYFSLRPYDTQSIEVREAKRYVKARKRWSREHGECRGRWCCHSTPSHPKPCPLMPLHPPRHVME